MNPLTTETLNVGQATVIESCPIDVYNGVVFEDDGETGYLYAIKRGGQQGIEILDAVHIYNTATVTDKHIPSEVKLFWNDTFDKVGLVINGYCHAIMDFRNRVGLCRNAFPPPSKNWPSGERRLTDKEVDSFFND